MIKNIFLLFGMALAATNVEGRMHCPILFPNEDGSVGYYTQTGSPSSRFFLTTGVSSTDKYMNRPVKVHSTDDFSIVVTSDLIKRGSIDVRHSFGPGGQPMVKRTEASRDVWKYTAKLYGPDGQVIWTNTYSSRSLIPNSINNPFGRGLISSDKHIVAPLEADSNRQDVGFGVWIYDQATNVMKHLKTIRTAERSIPILRNLRPYSNMILSAVGFSPDFSKVAFVEYDIRETHPYIRSVYVLDLDSLETRAYDLSNLKRSPETILDRYDNEPIRVYGNGGVEFVENGTILFRPGLDYGREFTLDLASGAISREP